MNVVYTCIAEYTEQTPSKAFLIIYTSRNDKPVLCFFFHCKTVFLSYVLVTVINVSASY